MMTELRAALGWILVMLSTSIAGDADELSVSLRSMTGVDPDTAEPAYAHRAERWLAAKTAVVVCDVWDYHHCLNAVRRLEEFAPRLNAVLVAARARGATIIHAPSDCMATYETHPARLRAMAVPKVNPLPKDIKHWCSQITAEAEAAYPIDQSDGGEDDDPAEHAAWAAKLTTMGRKPGTPWLAQSPLIAIDAERDYVTDRGDEVWSILKARGIERVILTGVHTNMCVLGRPFGLRQMVGNGMPVVLMRDLTDSMYNPRQWPYVDHFTGHDLVIAHVERYVCPTITSDQILDGEPFRSKFDRRPTSSPPKPLRFNDRPDFSKHWTVAALPGRWSDATHGAVSSLTGPAWYRCAVRVPSDWIEQDGIALHLAKDSPKLEVWFNGKPLTSAAQPDGSRHLRIPSDMIERDDANLLVLRVDHVNSPTLLEPLPTLRGREHELALIGRWHVRLGDDAMWSSIPLPARYGMPPDVVFVK
jgi:nicotinamidase-related amidase